MKVAHRDDYDTHAVIGGKEVQEFGIAQTAEFFTVLSNTLYSNKPLAVVREVLCNAWDAQIVSGRTDRPVIVKIDEDKMSIRDFGPGIPHDMIHAIYCVYGNSTKENDGNQTGGFGLGSKSPFAYSDHFTVVNHYGGTKTVHAISRGSALTQGKPDRRVMVTVPTTETGVEVMIPVKNREDMHQFIEIARDIAAFGEMNVLLNDKQVEIVPISTAENNMFLTTRKPRGSYDAINIRYGNVIYPVKPDAEYIGQWKRLKEIMDDIPSRSGHGGNDFVLILQAPANSISVTPSREALSNTETTIRTLKRLFNEIIDHMQTGNDMFEEKLLAEQAKAIDHLWANGHQERVWFSKNLLTDPFGPKTVNDGSRVFTQITNMVEFADYYLRYKEKISDLIKHTLSIQRVEMMLARGWRRPHDLKAYLKIMKSKEGWSYAEDKFKETIMRPLLRHVAKHPVLNHKALQIVQPPHRHEHRYAWGPYDGYTPDVRHFLKMLQGVVIVTHNKLAYQEDWDSLTSLKDIIPNDQQRMVYVAPRTKGHKEAAIELFTKLGYRVVDFCTILDEYRASNYVEPEKKIRVVGGAKPKNIGLVLLSHNLSNTGRHFNMSRHLEAGAPRSTDYTHVIKPESLSGQFHKRFFPWGDNVAAEIALLFGSKIAVCVSEPQLVSQKKKGLKDGIMLIAETVMGKVLSSPDIRTHVENKLGVRNAPYQLNVLMEMAQNSAVLKRAFALPAQSSEDDLIYYSIYESMVSNLRYYRSSPPPDGTWERLVWDTKEEVSKWQAAPAYAALSERVRESTGLDLIDLTDMNYALRRLDKINPDYRKKVFIETTVINALNLRD